MRLSSLSPQWLMHEGRRVGLVFKCPHCQKCHLSCFFEKFPKFSRGPVSQNKIIRTVLSERETTETPHCNSDQAWTASPPVDQATFDNLTVKPSLDASKSGHWHGHITNGECTP